MPKFKPSPLRVGFDMDGVLLYNPARVARPIIYAVKKYFFRKELTRFHYPKTPFQKFVWHALHKSSLWPAPGIAQIHRLVREKKIKAYIVTARYEFLKGDFNKWLDKLGGKEYFEDFYFNRGDEQPHEFKARMIKKLKLDVFVEDNWDIVKHLNKSKIKNQKSKVFWITNMIDRAIPYPYKFMNLRQAISAISRKKSKIQNFAP